MKEGREEGTVMVSKRERYSVGEVGRERGRRSDGKGGTVMARKAKGDVREKG